MARRSELTREKLEELAIDAGLALIKEEGFAHFSARKAAARMGYTVGTLYHLFGSYDEYLLHLNARTLDHWFSAMVLVMRKNPQRPLHALAQFYIRYSRENHHTWIALFEHHMRDGAPVPEWYKPKITQFFAPVEAALLPLVGNSAKAATHARILWAGIHGISILSLSGKLGVADTQPPEKMAEKMAESFVDTYLKGLGA